MYLTDPNNPTEITNFVNKDTFSQGYSHSLEAEMELMVTAASNHDQHGLLIHDARFHEIIAESCGNEMVIDVLTFWGGVGIRIPRG